MMKHFGKEVMAVLIKFRNHIELLSSRNGGKIAKNRFNNFLSSASNTDPVIFDFEGVNSISSSFADEFIGKTIADMGFSQYKEVTTFKNVNPFVSNVIRNSIYHRNENQFVSV